jgi:hypothetical protein
MLVEQIYHEEASCMCTGGLVIQATHSYMTRGEYHHILAEFIDYAFNNMMMLDGHGPCSNALVIALSYAILSPGVHSSYHVQVDVCKKGYNLGH